MKPSPRSPRGPSTSRPKPPDGLFNARFGGALFEGSAPCLLLSRRRH